MGGLWIVTRTTVPFCEVCVLSVPWPVEAVRSQWKVVLLAAAAAVAVAKPTSAPKR